MKKHLFLIIAFLLIMLSANAVRKIEANPINIAAILVEKTDSDDMSSICEYYGYIWESSDSNYTIYKHPTNGSIIKYTIFEEYPNQRLTTVEVKSKVNGKEIDNILKDLNFKPTNKGYERQSFGFVYHCTAGNHGYLMFTQQKKQKDPL